jgi:hypothetical protein
MDHDILAFASPRARQSVDHWRLAKHHIFNSHCHDYYHDFMTYDAINTVVVDGYC